MATLLQYRNGQLIPVKVDDKALKEHYSGNQPTVNGRPVYFEIKDQFKRKRMYGTLIMAFLVFDAALVALLAKMVL